MKVSTKSLERRRL